MNFTTEDITKYQELCRKYFNEEVDEQTAVEELNNLIFMVELIYHPLSDERVAKLRELVASQGDHSDLGESSKT